MNSNPILNETLNKTLDERARHCFGCGPANTQGLHLTFAIDGGHPEAPIATAHIQLTQLHEGPPGYIHGGIVATLLDEAMSKLNRPLKVLAMTRHMEVDYLRPAPLHQLAAMASSSSSTRSFSPAPASPSPNSKPRTCICRCSFYVVILSAAKNPCICCCRCSFMSLRFFRDQAREIDASNTLSRP